MARRFDVDDLELEQLKAAQQSSFGTIEVGRLVAGAMIRSPALIPDIGGMIVRAAKQGLYGDNGFVWFLHSERARRVAPDVATGAAWVVVDDFVPSLVPLLTTQSRVLEIGCGAGRISRHLAPLVAELVACDVSRPMLREARANLASHANVRLVQTTGFMLDEIEGPFDVVFAQGLMSHLDPLQLLALLCEARRLVSDNGRLVFNVDLMETDELRQKAVVDALESARSGYFGASRPRPYCEQQVRALCLAAGLKSVDVDYPGEGRTERVPAVVIATSRGEDQ